MPADLPRELVAFLATNLLRGTPESTLIDHLAADGHECEDVAAVLAAWKTHPLFEAALPFVQDTRRLQHLSRRADALLRGHPSAGALRVLDDAQVGDALEWLAEGVPVVLAGAARAMPAFETWGFESLRTRVGTAELTVSAKRPRAERDGAPFCPTRTMPFDAFVAHVTTHVATDDDPGFYLVADNRALAGPLASLLDDVRPDPRLCDARPLAAHAFLWLGPAGTVTDFHHDTRHVLMLQVRGDKRVRLVPPTDAVMMDGARTTVRPGEVEGALVRDVVLQEGDGLLIPMGYWHEVTAGSPSLTLSLTNLRAPDPPRFRLDGAV